MNDPDRPPDIPDVPNDSGESTWLHPDDPRLADLGATLAAALAPQTDVRDTARHKVDRALHARSAASGLTSMGSCALEAVRHLLTNPSSPADRYHMAETRLLADMAHRETDHG